MNRTLWMVGVLVAGMAASAAVGQEAELIVQLEAEQKTLQADRGKAGKRLSAIRDKLAGQADVAELKKAYEAASAAHEKNKKTNPEIQAARKAEREAFADYRKAMAAAAETSTVVKAAKAELEAANKAGADADKQRRAADSALWKVRRRIAASDDLRALQAEVAAKDKAIRDLRGTDAGLVAVRKTYEDAVKAYEKARRELPEYKAMNDARSALNTAVKNHAGVKDAEAARSAARKAVDKRVEELLAADPQGAAALASRQAAEQVRDHGRKVTRELWTKVQQATMAAVAKDPAAAEARKAYDAARAAGRKVERDAAGDTRQARDKARAAYDATMREALAADPEAVDLSGRLQALDKRLREVRRRIRELKRKTVKPPATE